MRITEADVENVLAQRLVISENVNWLPNKSRPDTLTCALRVHHEQRGELRVVITYSIPLMRITYNLVYRNEPIKRLDVAGRKHRNRCRDNRAFGSGVTHKHVLTDDCAMHWAYEALDITAGDPKGIFSQFCTECGITFEGQWRDVPPSQAGLM